MSYRLLITLLFFYFSFGVSAQPQWISLKFNHLTTKNGLSNSEVSCIVQDTIGYIWIGTHDGLNRYDGYNFKVFKHTSNLPGVIMNNVITALTVDKKGRLWIGNQQGVSLYNNRDESFTNFILDSTLLNSIIYNKSNAIVCDLQGNVIASTESGWLYKYIEKNKQFIRLSTPNLGLLKSMVLDNYNNLFIASQNSLYKYSLNLDTLVCISSPKLELNHPPSNKITCICIVDNDLWVGTEDKNILIYNIYTGKFSGIESKNQGQNFILHIDKDTNGNIWVGDFGGLRLYKNGDKKSLDYYHFAEDNLSLGGGGVSYIYNDRQGNYWIGIGHKGIDYILNNKKFKHYRKEPLSPIGLSDNLVSAILSDSKGRLWLGSYNGGVSIIAADESGIIRITHDNNAGIDMSSVQSIFEDRNGIVWVGTFAGGLYRWDDSANKFYNLKGNKGDPFYLPCNDVRAITEDRKGNLWLVTHGFGVTMVDAITKKTKTIKHDYSNNNSILDDWSFNIRCMSDGKLWVGGPSGISVIDPEKMQFVNYQNNVKDSGSLISGIVNSIYEDIHKRIWITTDYGFCMYNPETDNFINYSKKAGIDNNKFSAIISDKYGNVWISSNIGLFKYNPQNNLIKSFDDEDGIQSNEFLPGSCAISGKGMIYFGGREGVTGFLPEQITDNSNKPNVLITDFQLFNESVFNSNNDTLTYRKLKNSFLSNKQVELNFDQNVLTFGFIAFNYINPKKNKYAYKLEGFENNWNYVVDKREVTYTNLNPGTYTFRVKAANSDGYWNETGDYLIITIIPPLWKRTWFEVTIISFFVVLIYLLLYLRDRRNRAIKIFLEQTVRERTHQLEIAHTEITYQRDELALHRDHLEEIVHLRTSELEKAKLKAEESDKLKSSFLANMSHEIRTPMNAITGFIYLLNESDLEPENREKYMSIITRNSDVLLRLIDDILDFSKIEAGELKVSYQNVSLNRLVDELNISYLSFIKDRNSSSMRNVSFRMNNQFTDKFLETNPDIIISTDRLRVNQILTNLIENAIKFTEKGLIELGIEQQLFIDDTGEYIVLYVEDTGIGIPESEQPFIFDRFRKVETDISKVYRGVGLGLAISKRLAYLLGGSLNVISKPGVGSKFSLLLPYKSDISSGLSVPEVSVSNTIVQNKSDSAGKTILIAEDDESNYKLLETILLREGYVIVWAKDGEEAVKKSLKMDIHMVLMDIKLPLLSGIQAMKKIKQVKPQLPIIAQTAYALANEKEEMLSLGFDGYVSKPISYSALKENIGRLLA